MIEEDGQITTADIAASSATRDAPGRPEPDAVELEEGADEVTRVSLLPDEESGRFRDRWQEIQVGFVDRPRDAVAEADRLVADLMQRIAAQFSEERAGLEQQWDRDEDVSTEDLRVALTRYRSFFERLLSA